MYSKNYKTGKEEITKRPAKMLKSVQIQENLPEELPDFLDDYEDMYYDDVQEKE